MQEEMRKKVEKWQEKGPAKQGRVLPVPDMEPKKRRGGKRARKYKERYGLTDTKKVRPPCCIIPPVQGAQRPHDRGHALLLPPFQPRRVLSLWQLNARHTEAPVWCAAGCKQDAVQSA